MSFIASRPPIFETTEGYLRFLIWLIFAVISIFNVWASARFNLVYHFNGNFLFAIITCFPFMMIAMLLRFLGKQRASNIIEIIFISQIYAITFVFFHHITIIVSSRFPYYDAYFLAFDNALGLEWKAWALWLDKHPLLVNGLALHYSTFLNQFSLLLVGLIICKRHTEVYRLILTAIFVCFLCLVTAMFLPGEGVVPFTNSEETAFINHSFGAGFNHLPSLHMLREDSMRILYIGKQDGMIVFPSYHASFAIISIYALWNTFWWLRWLGVLVYTLMLASVYVIGGHYMADVVGGSLAALPCIWLACLIAKRRENLLQSYALKHGNKQLAENKIVT